MIPSPLRFGGHRHPYQLQADEINWKLINLTAVCCSPSISHSWRHGSSHGTSLSLLDPAGKPSPVHGPMPGPGSGWGAGAWNSGMGFATAAFVGVCGHLRGAGARGPGGGSAGGWLRCRTVSAAVAGGRAAVSRQAAAEVSCPVFVPRSRRCPCVLALGSSLEGWGFVGAGKQPALLELPGTLLPVPLPVRLSRSP